MIVSILSQTPTSSHVSHKTWHSAVMSYFNSYSYPPVCSSLYRPAGVHWGRQSAVCVSHDAGGGFLHGSHQQQYWWQSGGAQTRYHFTLELRKEGQCGKRFDCKTPYLSIAQALCRRAASSSFCWIRRFILLRCWRSAELSLLLEEPCSLWVALKWTKLNGGVVIGSAISYVEMFRVGFRL